MKGVDILWSKHPIYAGLDIDKRRESAVRKEIMGAEINWKGRELVLLVVAVSGTRSNAELLVDKPLVKIIGPYKPAISLSPKAPKPGPAVNSTRLRHPSPGSKETWALSM